MENINISNFCYEIIKQNNSIFNDLKQYDIDHTQNIQNIETFVTSQKCCKEYYNFIKIMLKSVKYISGDEFIRILDANITEIIKLIKDGYIPILIATSESISKSNIFYSLYFLNKMNEKGFKIEHIYDKIKNILDDNVVQNIKGTIGIASDKKILIILCDDISFSGSQLATHINETDFGPGFGEYQKNKLNLNNRIKIFLNVIGLLPSAKKLITNQFTNIQNLIIPTSIINLNDVVTIDKLINSQATLNNRSRGNYLKLIDCYVLLRNKDTIILESKLKVENIFNDNNYLDLDLIYSFQKYPDAQSTYIKLCYIRNFNKMLSLNVKKFLIKFQIKEELFCEKIRHDMDLKILMETFKIVNPENIIKIIYENYDNYGEILKNGINWLDYCDEVKNESNIINNKYGSWFKSMNNFNSKNEEAFNGNCNNKSPIAPFYKELELKLNTKTLPSIQSLTDLYSLYLYNSTYYQKYLKYKNKYLMLQKN